MRLHQSLFLLVAIAGSALAQNVAPVSGRVTAQNALFEEQYQSDLRNFPERATAFGDYRYNDKLAEYGRRLHKINVFVWRTTSGEPRDGSFEVRGHSLLHWANGGLTYWAVSDAAEPDLEAFRDAYMRN